MMTFPGISDDPLPPCPACGSNTWKKAGQVKDFSVSGEWFELNLCTACGLMMTHPQPEETRMGRYYASTEYISHSDTRTGLINKLYHKARTYMLKKKYDWVTEATGRNKGHLLDVGAGTGHFAHFMQTKGWNVVALEPDETARNVARQKLGIRIEPLEALATQQKATYDVITLWHVLEHVHDIEGYLEHFASILKPDGVLLVAVPNHTSADSKHYKTKWAAYDVPRHVWHFSPESMEKLFARHHFTLAKKRSMPLDAFYVSMLSEKYKGNDFFGPVAAFISGWRSFLKSRQDVDASSSIIYIGKLK